MGPVKCTDLPQRRNSRALSRHPFRPRSPSELVLEIWGAGHCLKLVVGLIHREAASRDKRMWESGEDSEGLKRANWRIGELESW